MAVTAPDPGTERPYRFDERLRMIPVDRANLTARVAAADPHDFAGLRRLGIALMLLGRHDEALDRLDAALDLVDTEHRRITVWINLADVYRYRGEPGPAEVLYRRALDAARTGEPELVSFAAHHLGKSLAEQHRPAEAREFLNAALRLRVADGDTELIESTRAALEHLDELALPLPAEVAALVGPDAVWSAEHAGRSGELLRIGPYWVRRGPRAVAEHDRLRWLDARGIPVPTVAAFAEDVLVLADGGRTLADAGGRDGVVTDPGDGDPGSSVGARMGGILRRLHAIPAADCPFDASLDALLAAAHRRVHEGLVDESDFDDERRGHSAGQVLARLRAERPAAQDPVVTHGDFTPDNVLTDGALLDVGGLGVGDRYRDLALAERELAEYGPGEIDAFRAAYGLAAPDPARLAYFRLLDELF
ncbi:aminoglycoside phosphotransferase APH(3') [Nocardia thailandica]|uniref:aminoglycoside phosphotransferase APH(3') n=1 Tax=Nocardia thailandica TaxID=257275 RepID=UPI0002F3BDD3|nr:aminoglycoside phosphotransferase APH(3') [Nocardia thailandica]